MIKLLLLEIEMGHWGNELLASDSASDAYELFMEAYDSGSDARDIRQTIINEMISQTSSQLDRASCLAGLSLAQWECGVLSAEDLEELGGALDGIDDRLDPQERVSLKMSSEQLVTKLSLPKKRARKRKVEKPTPGVSLEEGDCIALFIGNRFGAALVTRILISRGKRWHRFVPLAILEPQSPTISDFERRSWIMEDFSFMRKRASRDVWGGMRVEDWMDRPKHVWIHGGDLRKNLDKWSLVCKLPIQASDPVRSVPVGDTENERWVGEDFGSWNSLVHSITSSSINSHTSTTASTTGSGLE